MRERDLCITLRAKVIQGKNRRDSGVSVPLFMGITGVNEHIEPVFNAVLPSAVVMQMSRNTSKLIFLLDV